MDGTRVAFDSAAGCLQRLSADGRVLSANCHGWQAGGLASPDGRYLSLEWRATEGGVRRGRLDLTTGQVTTWPLTGTGTSVSWLGPSDALLVSDVPDPEEGAEERAWCRLDTGFCSKVPPAVGGVWEGKDWFGR
jgi:hypothetical protein